MWWYVLITLGTQEEAEAAESVVQGLPNKETEKKPAYVCWDNIMQIHCSN